MELDILITGSSRPQLFPYCWESFKKYFHFEGKMNVYYHEDFVFPDKSKKVLEYLKTIPEITVITHNPAIGLGKSMDHMFQNYCKSKYLFYLQEDWELERPIDVNRLIYVMEQNNEVRMIGLNKIKNTGSLNGSPQPQYTYSGVDMILYHGWSFMPGLWNMDFVRKHWRVREERPEGYFTNAFGTHDQREDCEYWRMAKWRLENGKPGGCHDASRMDDPYRAPWLGEMPYRPVQHGDPTQEQILKEMSENPKEMNEN